MGKIHSYIACESIKIKVQESSTPLVTTHVNDFEYHFLDVDYRQLLPEILENERYTVFFCVCLCVLFLSCIGLS